MFFYLKIMILQCESFVRKRVINPNRSFLCKDPETILPVPYLSREIERFAAISILDWHRKNVGWRDKSANANRGGEGGGGGGRGVRTTH